LSRTKLKGPSTYARLALGGRPCPGLRARLPWLVTKPAGPAFCPEFLDRREADVSIDAACMRALVEQVLAATLPSIKP
jgi:hypothetical protein